MSKNTSNYKSYNSLSTLVLALICLPTFLFSQNTSIVQLSRSDGLPDNWIHSTLVDDDGYLWLGTQDGAVQYNGKNLTIFQEEFPDTTMLSGNIIKDIYQDSEGFIWLCIQGGGLDYLDPKTGKIGHFYSKPNTKNALPTDVLTCFLPDKNDTYLWVGTYEHGLCYINKATAECEQIDLENPIPKHHKDRFLYNSANDLVFVEGMEDYIYVAANNIGLVRMHKQNRTLKSYIIPSFQNLEATATMCLFSDRPNELWIGSWSSGLVRLNTKTEKIECFPIDKSQYLNQNSMANIVKGIARKSADELWVATNDMGLHIFNTQTQSFKAFEDKKIQIPKRLTSVYSDNFGRTIVCSEREGSFILQVHKQNFTPFINPAYSKSSSTPKFVSTFAENADTNGVFYTFDRGKHVYLQTLTGTLDSFEIESQVFDAQFLMNMLTDSRGWTWLCATKGQYGHQTLWVKRKGQKKFEAFNGFENQKFNFNFDVTALTEDSQHQLWIGTNENGLIRINFEKKDVKALHSIPEFPEFKKDLRVTDIKQAPDGKIWVTSLYDGAFYINPDLAGGRWFKVGQLKEYSIKSIAFNGDDVWLGTSGSGIQVLKKRGGFYHAHTNIFSLFKKRDGLSDEKITKMSKDALGRIWVSSLYGLSVFDSVKNSFISFDKQDGLLDPFLQERKGLAATKSGHIYIGQDGGFLRKAVTNINEIKQKHVEPPIVLTDFEIINQSILNSKKIWPAKINIPAEKRIITIHFSQLNFFSQSPIQYAWELKGIDKEIRTCTGCNTAAYSNLKGGEYTFSVWVTNAKGERISPNVANLDFTVQKHIYEQNWFNLLIFILLASIGYLIYKWRIQRLNKAAARQLREAEFKRNEAELREQIALAKQQAAEIEMTAMRAQMNPHFIFNCLNSINTFILMNEPDQASEYLSKFSKLMRLVLDNSRSNLISLANELNTLRFYVELEQMRFDDKFSFEIDIEKGVEPQEIDVPPMLIQPFLENAIWHGLLHKKDRTGHLKVRFELKYRKQKAFLHVLIEDNGIGRAKAAEFKSKSATRNKSHGLKITTERLKSLNNQLGMEAEFETVDKYHADGAPAGTSVSVWIPIQ